MTRDQVDGVVEAASGERTGREDDVVSGPRWIWVVRGLLAGVMIIGSANALSFFFRSRGWGSLLGNRDFADEAIGFPLLVWQESVGYGTHALKIAPFLIDIGAGLLIGVVVGLWAMSRRATLNPIMKRLEGRAAGGGVQLQFSLRGLMVATVLVAVAAGAARVFTPRVEVLAAIYAFGPISLVVLAYLPRRLSWRQRVAILIPCACMMIAFAIVLGGVLEIEFDKVLMGIFICWTPQAALAAMIITGWVMWREYRGLRQSLADELARQT